jgi:hypothetical protein
MEKANNLSGVRVKPSHVRPLEAIAMDTGEGKIFKFSLATMLSCNDVIDLEGCRMKSWGQLTVFTAIPGALPNPADEISLQDVRLLSGALQSAASLRLHDSEQIAHVEVTIELSFFFSGQFALPSQLRQLVHALDIAFAKANGQQILGCAARQGPLPDLNHAGENRRFGIWACHLRTHLSFT